MPHLLNIHDVMDTTSLGRTTIWRAVKAGAFPPPLKLGVGIRKAWLADEVSAWISERKAERDRTSEAA